MYFRTVILENHLKSIIDAQQFELQHFLVALMLNTSNLRYFIFVN